MRQELSDALAVLPLIRSDLSRPVASELLQTDACDTGAAVVYTATVDHSALRQECMRPRHNVRTPEEYERDPWSAAADLRTSVRDECATGGLACRGTLRVPCDVARPAGAHKREGGGGARSRNPLGSSLATDAALQVGCAK